MVIKKSLEEKAKIIKPKIHPWVDMYILILKDSAEEIFGKKLVHHAKETEIPDFVLSFLNGEHRHIPLPIDFIVSAESFATSDPENPKFTDFAFIKKMGDNVPCLGASNGEVGYYVYYDELYDIIDYLDEPFPIPPLWNIWKDEYDEHDECNKYAEYEEYDEEEDDEDDEDGGYEVDNEEFGVDLFPDVDGRPFIKLHENGIPICIIWWEINPPSLDDFSPRHFDSLSKKLSNSDKS